MLLAEEFDKYLTNPEECTSSSILKGSHPRKVEGVIAGTVMPSRDGGGSVECN